MAPVGLKDREGRREAWDGKEREKVEEEGMMKRSRPVSGWND